MLENMGHSPYPAGGWRSVGKCIQLEASNFICAGGKAAARLSQPRRNVALGLRWWKRAWPLMVARLPSAIRQRVLHAIYRCLWQAAFLCVMRPRCRTILETHTSELQSLM